MARNRPWEVTVLVEDTVHCPELCAEHGLAVLVEWEDNLILYDTGQSDLLLQNAERMSLDLRGISQVVLSHGHYDHTGGLVPLLRRARKAAVVAHPNIFDRKFVKEKDGISREIGIPFSRSEVEKACAGLHLQVLPREIVPGIYATGEIGRETDFEGPESDFFIGFGPDERQDSLLDDQALVVDTRSGLVVLVGCAHAGIINTLRHVRQMFPRRRIAILAGGMHLASTPSERILRTVEGMKEFEVKRIVAGHCTGWKPICSLAAAFGDRFSRLTVGTVLGEQ